MATVNTDDDWAKFASADVKAVHVLKQDDGKPFELVTVQASDDVIQALTVLTKHNILCAGVLSQEGIIGCVDLVDIVAFVVDEFEKRTPSDKALARDLQRPISKLINVSGRNKFHKLVGNAHLYQLLNVLARHDVHRVWISNPVKTTIFDGVVTQFSLLKWIYQHKCKATGRFAATVQEVWPGQKEVISINHKLSLFKAFKLLHESNVTAVAVIDDEGKLMGNISASDLRVVSLTSNIMDH